MTVIGHRQSSVIVIGRPLSPLVVVVVVGRRRSSSVVGHCQSLSVGVGCCRLLSVFVISHLAVVVGCHRSSAIVGRRCPLIVGRRRVVASAVGHRPP